ncbi:hypothetical protein PENSUB_3992 [Penicillium subrubescens]|uniref:Uncharacterized protein n=1 Tax=Penicillium subrubescens TaxID=1316194 RepID=A0A1Q5UDZ6_9EURO|nr:hypothetical protein PENSUB_3992 [Penicillium subrubescens]
MGILQFNVNVCRYTRSLEERIAELEAQLSQTHQIETSNSQQRVVIQSAPIDDSTVLDDVDRNPERNESEPVRNSVRLLDAELDSSHTHAFDEANLALETQHAQHLVVPSCTSTSGITFSSPLYTTGLITSSIPGDQCGHTSLLTSILATLTKGAPCGISPPGDRALSHVHLSPNIATQLLSPDHFIRLPKHVEDTLIKIYLERVNPRYPFLHVSTFLEWYETWKARPKEQPIPNQKYRWKDFFVTMVWSKE